MTRQILIIAIASFVLAQIATFATSIYLHRALAHLRTIIRSVEYSLNIPMRRSIMPDR